MPSWSSILLIVVLSLFVIAGLAATVHHSHRRMPDRQAAEGDPADISAPLPRHVAKPRT
jgi:hypothetical protein